MSAVMNKTNIKLKAGDMALHDEEEVEIHSIKGGWTTYYDADGRMRKDRNSTFSAIEDPESPDYIDEEDEADIQAELTDEADTDEDEDEPCGSIVSEKYRDEYRARGNPDHCGDWLANMLEGQFTKLNENTQKPVFDDASFIEMLAENDVDMSGKWARLPESGGRGWQGRFRMNGRQKLELRVAHSGVLVLRGRKMKVPSGFLQQLRTRHANWEEA